MNAVAYTHDVFLSHSSKDKVVVRELAERLRRDGLRVWFDEWEIKVADCIPAKIEEGLERSRVLVLCMSANAFGAGWPQLESGTFRFRDPLNTERCFIPLRLDEAPIKGSLALFLHVSWLPADREREYVRLLAACRDAASQNPPVPDPTHRELSGWGEFTRLGRDYGSSSIDENVRLKNLAKADWRYDQLFLPPLLERGWVRFAAGFKSGIYGHPRQPWCIKMMGMGVGDNPSYFAGRGYYNSHERRMLDAFGRSGFSFQPRAKSVEESIDFLVAECGVQAGQARWQCENHHVLVTERISGIPFATATGDFLHYDSMLARFDSGVLRQCEQALRDLKTQLDAANRAGLLHNDPVPTNILFALEEGGAVVARLVDFELAQNLGEPSPEYVANSVREQYSERDVPFNAQTGKHLKNLDQHLMDQAIEALDRIRKRVEDYERDRRGRNWLSFSFSFVGGIAINFRGAVEF